MCIILQVFYTNNQLLSHNLNTLSLILLSPKFEYRREKPNQAPVVECFE